MKILICGLPGSGKTTLAKKLQYYLNCAWYNADVIRKAADDWDFTEKGRFRQSSRMKALADFESSHGRVVICDFIAPTSMTRVNFDADLVIWMDTVDVSCYPDTNAMFEKPVFVFKRVVNFLTDEEVEKLAGDIQNYV